jgi:hypothetical protein
MGLTKGSLANKGRSVLRFRRTGRTRIIAKSQGNGGFSLADSQSAEQRSRSQALQRSRQTTFGRAQGSKCDKRSAKPDHDGTTDAR